MAGVSEVDGPRVNAGARHHDRELDARTVAGEVVERDRHGDGRDLVPRRVAAGDRDAEAVARDHVGGEVREGDLHVVGRADRDRGAAREAVAERHAARRVGEQHRGAVGPEVEEADVEVRVERSGVAGQRDRQPCAHDAADRQRRVERGGGERDDARVVEHPATLVAWPRRHRRVEVGAAEGRDRVRGIVAERDGRRHGRRRVGEGAVRGQEARRRRGGGRPGVAGFPAVGAEDGPADAGRRRRRRDAFQVPARNHAAVSARATP